MDYKFKDDCGQTILIFGGILPETKQVMQTMCSIYVTSIAWSLDGDTICNPGVPGILLQTWGQSQTVTHKWLPQPFRKC